MINLKLPARHSQSTLLWILFSSILFSNCQKSDDPINIPDPDEEIRETLWNQPYSSRSIWNMPIHKNAEYQFIGDDFYHHNKYVDDVYITYVSPDDPLVRLRENDCGTWEEKCEDCGPHPVLPDQIRFPNMNIGCGSANNTFAFAFPDDAYMFSQAMGRKNETGTLYFRPWTKLEKGVDLCGAGLEEGGHGATGLSALGGTIRKGELIGDKNIDHVLKVTAWAIEYCFPSNHRWPAKTSDGYSERYRGNRENLKIGALLALHKDMDVDAMGFETEVGKKLALAARDYGIYFVEDSYDWGEGQGAWGWVLEYGVQEETERSYGINMRGSGSDTPYFRDIDRITRNLYVVNNNGPGMIGGGDSQEVDYPAHRLRPLKADCEQRTIK